MASAPTSPAVRPAPDSLPQSSEAVAVRVIRNAAWLFCSEGITKGLFFVANVLLARFLSASDYGVLALAQSWILYAWIVADLGIMMYGQAEAARRPGRDRTAAMAWELLPLRALAGVAVFLALTLMLPLFTAPGPLRVTIAAASLYLLGQALSAEWLLRGKERFDAVMMGNAAGAVVFLAAVLMIGSSSGASAAKTASAGTAYKDALAWALSSFAMAAVYVGFLPRLIGWPRLRNLSAAGWPRHVREASFVALSSLVGESYRVTPFFLLGILATSREVGLFAAPMRLVVNLGGLGFLIPMAFYPASARLFCERPELFAASRKALVLTMLAMGLPAAIIGTRLALPIITLIFGERYRASAPIFAVLVWKLPLYFVRYVYGTSIIATGFQRLHLLASALAMLIALAAGFPLVRHFGAAGAAASLLLSEIGMTAAMVLISARVHRESAMPEPSCLIRLALLAAATWSCGYVFNRAAAPVSAALMIVTYLIGLGVLDLADWPKLLRQFVSIGVFRVRAPESN
jgi:O-antigen/teichoic acid export membrane protein